MSVSSLDEVRALSDIFLAQTDRTRLGRFAVPVDALAAMDMLQRSRLLLGAEKPSGFDGYTELADAVDYACAYSEKNFVTALIEMLFWWDNLHESLWENRNALGLDSYVYDGIKDLGAVYDNPDMHDYFEVGLWDVPFIRQCVADGVDASLALDMSKT